ncbi:MAG: cation diffusion facilitator family transporter [Lysobacter sp.]
MGSGHDHGTTAIRHERPLWWALGLTGGFLIAEVIGAFLTNSLALLSDAAHMGTDTLALMIALTAVRLSRKPADAKRSFGYVRMEAMGAMVNGLMLFGVAGYILWEAAGRFSEPPQIATTGMLVIASLGLIVNLISMRLLQAGSGESLNMKGAYLEVWSDMLGSVAVIAGAIVIRFTGWTVVDPILAVLIGLWVLPRTWTLLREAGNVLMEGVPKGIDLDVVRALLSSTPGVIDVHDLHVWSLGSSTPAMTAHLVVAEGTDGDALRRELTQLMDERYGIEHCTLQIEATACEGEACDAAHG